MKKTELSSSCQIRHDVTSMMDRLEGMFERHKSGELIPGKYKNVAEERAVTKPSDPVLFKKLYWKAVKENRTISSVGIEADITTNNLYRWARKEGLSIDTKHQQI